MKKTIFRESHGSSDPGDLEGLRQPVCCAVIKNDGRNHESAILEAFERVTVIVNCIKHLISAITRTVLFS